MADNSSKNKKSSKNTVFHSVKKPKTLWKSSPSKIKWSFVDDIDVKLNKRVA